MTVQEAIDRVKLFESHMWVYEVAMNDGQAIIVVGGQDHHESIRAARAAGCIGPIMHVY